MTNSYNAVEDRGFDCMGHSCHEEIVGPGMLIAENEVMDLQGQGDTSYPIESEIIPLESFSPPMSDTKEPNTSQDSQGDRGPRRCAMDAAAMSKIVDALHRNIVDVVREDRVQESRRTILASIKMIEAVHAEGGISLEDATASYLELAKAVVETTE